MRGLFRRFDFDHPVFTSSRPEVQAMLRKAYKSGMTGSEFIAEYAKLGAESKRNGNHYRNAHKAHEKYQKLDDLYNFFGHYPE